MLKDIWTNNIQPETTDELNNHCSITESEEGDIIFKMDISSISARPRPHSGTQSSSTIYINNEMKESRAENIFSHVDRHLMSIIVSAGRCLTDLEMDPICDKTINVNLSKALPKVFGGMSLAQIKSNVKIYNEIMDKMDLRLLCYPDSATNLIKNFTINVEIDDIPFNILMILEAPINHRLIMYYALLMKDASFKKIIKDVTRKFDDNSNMNTASRHVNAFTNTILNKIDASIELHNKAGISTMFTEPEIIKYLVYKYGIVINNYPEEYKTDIISLAEVSMLRDITDANITRLFLDMAESMMLNTSLINNGNDTEIIVNTNVHGNRNNITNKIRIPLSYMIYNTINKDSIIMSHLKSLMNPQIYSKVSSCLYGYINDKNEFIACNDVDKITHAILTYYSDSRITVDNSNQDKVTCIISIIYERNMSDDEMPFISMLMYEL